MEIPQARSRLAITLFAGGDGRLLPLAKLALQVGNLLMHDGIMLLQDRISLTKPGDLALQPFF